jgi:hypothetical protein
MLKIHQQPKNQLAKNKDAKILLEKIEICPSKLFGKRIYLCSQNQYY